MLFTIDHIGGGGKIHRRESGEPNISLLLYNQFKRDGEYPTGFQILCWNCNSAKHFHGEEVVRKAVARLKNRI